MSFHAVKFQTKILYRATPQDKRIDEIRKWAKIFHANNLTPIIESNISCGNLSFRINPGENKFIITCSQMGFNKELSEDAFAQVFDCNFEQGVVFALGEREPSSESMLHFAIYKSRPEVNAIFHGHSAKILENYSSLKLVETVKEQPYGTPELAFEVLDVLKDNNFVVMKNHGFVSVAETMDEAGNGTLKILFDIYSPSNSTSAKVL